MWQLPFSFSFILRNISCAHFKRLGELKSHNDLRQFVVITSILKPEIEGITIELEPRTGCESLKIERVGEGCVKTCCML